MAAHARRRGVLICMAVVTAAAARGEARWTLQSAGAQTALCLDGEPVVTGLPGGTNLNRSTDETTATFVRPPGADGASCALRWGARPLLCRLAPAANADVVQMQIGRPSPNDRADSLFDRDRDRALTVVGARLVPDDSGFRLQPPEGGGGAITARVTERLFREQLGVPTYQPMDAIKRYHPRPPSGWLSWYVYYQNVRAEDVLAQADWVRAHLAPFGAQYIVIDDGWQGTGEAGRVNRDWEGVTPRFAHSTRSVVEAIHARGLKAGLWLVPQGQSDAEFVQANVDAFLWRPDGHSVLEPAPGQGDNFVGEYLVDASGAAGRGYLDRLAWRLVGAWGYDYLKIDGQPIVQDEYTRDQAQFDDPKTSPQDAYRAGLRALRNVMGPERFLAGCWGTPLWGVGIMDGARTGGDVGVDENGLQTSLDATRNGYFLHNIVWYSDPDVVNVRSSLSLAEARTWATMLGLTGQLLLAGDDLTALPEERVELLRRIFPAQDITPVELYRWPGAPRVWDLKVGTNAEPFDVVGLFNWGGGPATVTVPLGDLGLRTEGARYLAYDFWERRYLGPVLDGKLQAALPAHGCAVYAVCRDLGRPQVISTSRHVTQGAADLHDVRWHAERQQELAGVADVVGGDPYEVRVALPVAPVQYEVARAAADGGRLRTQVAPGLLRLTLERATNGPVRWRVRFTVHAAEAAALAAPAVRRGRTIVPLTLSWTAVPGAAGYRVLSGGEAVATTAGTTWTASGPGDGAYAVTAYGYAGQESAPSAPVAVPVLPGRSVWLEELVPASASQGWGTLQRGRSVTGGPLQIGDRQFTHGLGTHAQSEVVYYIGGRYEAFEAGVGLDVKARGTGGSVVFRVLTDGNAAFDSGRMTWESATQQVRVSLRACRELRLVVTDAGDGNNTDHANWADARLVAAPEDDAQWVYLSDLQPEGATQGYGTLQRDQAVTQVPLSIGGIPFSRGLGSHAPGEITYALDGRYEVFVASLGIDDNAKAPGSVGFQVWADDDCLYDSGVLRSGAGPAEVAVSVAGARRLRLVMTEGGDGRNCDHADWGAARLLKAP